MGITPEELYAKLVALAKTVDDGTLVYLARVSGRRRNLAAVSMWKYLPGVEPSVASERALKEKAPHKAGLESKPRSLSDYESDARARTPRATIDEGGELNQPDGAGRLEEAQQAWNEALVDYVDRTGKSTLR